MTYVVNLPSSFTILTNQLLDILVMLRYLRELSSLIIRMVQGVELQIYENWNIMFPKINQNNEMILDHWKLQIRKIQVIDFSNEFSYSFHKTNSNLTQHSRNYDRLNITHSYNDSMRCVYQWGRFMKIVVFQRCDLNK